VVAIFEGGELNLLVGALMITVCGVVSALAIRKAKDAEPNKSWLHAIGGWLLGFCAVNAAIFLSVGFGVLLALAVARWT
jgi:hypothetical protein